MKNECKNLNDVFGEMMQFCGMCNGQTGNKTIQELKKDKAIEKYTTYSDKSEQLHSVLEKIKNTDKEIIEEFDGTLLDGLD